MTYIDAFHDRDSEAIHIVERANGKRIFQTFKPEYSFYYPDAKGRFKSIFGNPLSKFETQNIKHFRGEQKHFQGQQIFESDVKPVFKCLEKHYFGRPAPELHNASLDIEVGFCPERGFAPPTDPHQPITAISLRMDWMDQLVTLVLPPEGMKEVEYQEIVSRFENCIAFTSEVELLETFYELLEDIDVLYTWNGEGFDIPYIINRTQTIIGKDITRKFCLWNQFPVKKEYERYGKVVHTYDLVGRLHLDYLDLYRKYTYHELQSYRLDAVGEYELNETKLQYEGTLDQLYRNDFEKFIEYNRQDVNLLSKLDEKLKFIDLTNILAHDNCVLFGTTMGAVALTDQAIVLECHKRGVQAFDRRHGLNEDSDGMAGAYVADPKVGLHNWIGSVDINSLYPSAIRALNMSPETVIGQVLHTLTKPFIKERIKETDSFAEAWGSLAASLEYTEVMNKTDTKLQVKLEGTNEIIEMSAAEIYDWIFNNSTFSISSNGTIFNTEEQGIIPGLLTTWYAERKEIQAKKKDYQKLEQDATTPEEALEAKKMVRFWDQRNMAKKINLNAAYGAISNPGSRFCDQRIGQSTTLSGRTITKHMIAFINELLTGTYDTNGDCIVYGDTDSCYFSIEPIKAQLAEQGFEISKDTFLELSNNIADQVNDAFPDFVQKAFHVNEDNSKLIKCAKDICATAALFVKKKRYAALVYDQEGVRKDQSKTGQLKIMGMDTQRADSPKFIQDFLSSMLLEVLEGHSEVTLLEKIRDFRQVLTDYDPWLLGTPKRVNNMTKFGNIVKQGVKATIPGHVRASLNWNELKRQHGDHHSMQIDDGQKTIICKLRPNNDRMTSIAYPIDELRLPNWFKKLPFDQDLMIETLLDQKVENIIGVLGWDLASCKSNSTFFDLFTLE